jgi:diguanylate cyclase
MQPSIHPNNKQRAKRLIAIFSAVLVLTSTVIVLTLASGKTLNTQATQLIDYRIPELGEINTLHSAMSDRSIQLYLYYATFDSDVWSRQDQQLTEILNASLNALRRLGLSDIDCEIFLARVAEFNKIGEQFDHEMKKGDERDWDTLRMHLANAQLKLNDIAVLLKSWNVKINMTAQQSGVTALNQVSHLTQLQLGFSLAVMIVSGFILLALYKRLKDQDELYHRAYYDDVTGLPNRLCLEKDAEQTLSTLHQGALLVIHVDRLNVIASTYGHVIADQLLMAIARRIKTQSAPLQNSLYRVTSDSFTLIIQSQQKSNTLQFALNLTNISAQSFQIGERQLRGNISIGVAEFSTQDTAANLLRNAFAAIHAQHVSGNIHIFEPRMTAESEQWLSTESALRTALQQQEFELHYQPKVDAQTLAIVSSEALIRWRHQDKLVSPANFIPIAEESGLIIPIGNWVLLEACKQWREWHNQSNISLPIAINISAQQFQDPAFLMQVQSALERYQVPPEMIELEVTEAVATHDPESAVASMHALKEIGVTLAIDDFGTGYSSLSYLKRFPIDTLKIDIAFVRNIHTSKDDEAIAGMILALGKQLKLKVIAEGVELEEQQLLLAAKGCDIFQGYLFSKPLPAAQFAEHLNAR